MSNGKAILANVSKMILTLTFVAFVEGIDMVMQKSPIICADAGAIACCEKRCYDRFI